LALKRKVYQPLQRQPHTINYIYGPRALVAAADL